jgi:hypothetical protein
MKLEQFRVIPQNNVRTKAASLDDLKPLIKLEIIKPDLVYLEAKDQFKILPSFIREQKDTQGFTVIYDGTHVVLLRTDDTVDNEDLKPKFLKGSKAVVTFTNDYLRLLTKDLGDGLFLHKFDLEGFEAFQISDSQETPKNLVVELQTDYISSYVADIIPANSINSVSTTKEESFSYMNDQLDEEKEVLEPEF